MADSIARQIADFRNSKLRGFLHVDGSIRAHGYPVAASIRILELHVDPAGDPFDTDADLVDYVVGSPPKKFDSITAAVLMARRAVSYDAIVLHIAPGTYTETIENFPNVSRILFQGTGQSVHNFSNTVNIHAELMHVDANMTWNLPDGKYVGGYDRISVFGNRTFSIVGANTSKLVLACRDMLVSGTLNVSGSIEVYGVLDVSGQMNVNSAAATGAAVLVHGVFNASGGTIDCTAGTANNVRMEHTAMFDGRFPNLGFSAGTHIEIPSVAVGKQGHAFDVRSQITTQWGTGNIATPQGTVNFNTPFIHMPFLVIAVGEGQVPVVTPRGAWTLGTFEVQARDGTSNIGNFSWIAIGA